jgi:predicted aminopeptidase
VSAAGPTSLAAYEWDYPILGALPYRGFFSLADAEALADDMASRGLDVDVRPVRTYSLLGVLPDPIVSPMLYGSDELSLVETVIHELAHATVFAVGKGAFNEGLATFIGRAGTRRFLERAYGASSAVFARYEAVEADRDAYARATGALAFDLRVLYAQAERLPDEELRARKDAIFLAHQQHFRTEVTSALATFAYRSARLPVNNAELVAYGIYTLRQELYARVFDDCNASMRCFVDEMRQVTGEDDPEIALLEGLAQTHDRERILR